MDLKRDKKLSENEIKEFLEQHIPYRYSAIKAWYDKIWLNTNVIDFKIVCFEAALLHSRLFIQFFGLGIKTNPLKLCANYGYSKRDNKIDEVKVIDLGGKFIELTKLKTNETEVLAKVYYGANKASAHLTYDSAHGMSLEDLNYTIEIIERYLNKYLYDIVGIKLNKYTKKN